MRQWKLPKMWPSPQTRLQVRNKKWMQEWKTNQMQRCSWARMQRCSFLCSQTSPKNSLRWRWWPRFIYGFSWLWNFQCQRWSILHTLIFLCNHQTSLVYSTYLHSNHLTCFKVKMTFTITYHWLLSFPEHLLWFSIYNYHCLIMIY